jgi:hypothetical protein
MSKSIKEPLSRCCTCGNFPERREALMGYFVGKKEKIVVQPSYYYTCQRRIETSAGASRCYHITLSFDHCFRRHSEAEARKEWNALMVKETKRCLDIYDSIPKDDPSFKRTLDRCWCWRQHEKELKLKASKVAKAAAIKKACEDAEAAVKKSINDFLKTSPPINIFNKDKMMNELKRNLESMGCKVDLKFVPPDNIHVTIVPPKSVDRIKK